MASRTVSSSEQKANVGGSKKLGPHAGSPYDPDHSILGPVLGPPIYGNPHFVKQGIVRWREDISSPQVQYSFGIGIFL